MPSPHHSSDAPSDGQCVRDVQQGQTDAFRLLIDRYKGMVFTLTHRYAATNADAEDLAQEVFMKAFQKIEHIDQPDRFASWLYGLALNHCRDYAKDVRRGTYAFSESEQEGADVPQPGPRQDDAVAARDDADRLWAALDELSPTYAIPFLLKYRDGWTYKAMAQRLDVSVSALKVRVHRARKKLQALLDEHHTFTL